MELLFVLDGEVGVSLEAPGGRVVEIGRVGPGGVLGEIGLLEGGKHTMTLRATRAHHASHPQPPRLRGTARPPGRFVFRAEASLASQFTFRLRNQLQQLAETLGDEPVDGARSAPELEACGPPDSRYLSRLATSHDFDPVALWGFLTSGSYAMCPPGRTLFGEGEQSEACYLTINGAVEKVLVRGDRRVRVDLAGPGKAFSSA